MATKGGKRLQENGVPVYAGGLDATSRFNEKLERLDLAAGFPHERGR